MLKLKSLLSEAPEDVAADIQKSQEGGLKQAVQLIGKIAVDKDFQALANAGETDADPKDEIEKNYLSSITGLSL